MKWLLLVSGLANVLYIENVARRIAVVELRGLVV